jgi:hypothetical protein
MEFRHRGIECLSARIDDNRPLGAQLIQVEAHGLADPAFDAVTHNRLTDCARDSEPDVRTARFGFAQTKRGQQGTRHADPFVVNPSKILRSEDADTFRKAWDCKLPFVADGELFASGRATARENGPAVLGLHTRAESVSFRAVTVIRLKSTFRHLSSII